MVPKWITGDETDSMQRDYAGKSNDGICCYPYTDAAAMERRMVVDDVEM